MKFPVHHGEVDLSYVFDKAEGKSDKMLVVFQGRKDLIGPIADFRFPLMKLSGIHRLFIVDDLFDCSSMPYICVNKEPVIENTFISLVEKLKTDYALNDVLMFGSSAAGTAGIYYGFKYNFHMCLLSPGYLVGSSLHGKDALSQAILERATGLQGEAGRDYLNALIRNSLLENAEKFSKRIFVTFGCLERGYKHFLLLRKDCQANGIALESQIAAISGHVSAIDYFLDVALAKIYEIFFGYADNSRYNDYAGKLNKITVTLLKERNGIQKAITADGLALESKVNVGLISPFVIPVKESVNEADLLLDNKFLTDPGGGKNIAFDATRQYWETAAPTPWFKMQRLELRVISLLCSAFRQSGDVKFLAKAVEIIDFGLEKAFIVPGDTVYDRNDSSELRLLRLAELMSTCHEAGFRIDCIETLKRFLCRHVWIREGGWRLLPVKKTGELMLFTYAALFRNDNVVGRRCAVAALKSLLARISVYFPSCGLAVTGGAEWNINEYHTHLAPIIHYYRANGLNEDLPEWKDFCRKADEIRNAAEHLVSANGFNVPLGNTRTVEIGNSPYKPYSFLPAKHSLKILKSEKALVSVNGLYDMDKTQKHNDELAFTFMYDGVQIVYDSGGKHADKKIDDHLKSVYAHSGIFADDGGYFCDLFEFASTAEEFADYAVAYGLNNAYENVVIKRILVWLRDNTVILLDSGKSKDGKPHKFTQNFIFAAFEELNFDKGGFEALLAEGNGVRLKLRQYGTPPDGFLASRGPSSLDGYVHFGNNERLRRERVAYEITAPEAGFMTVLMAGSGRDKMEYSDVKIARVKGKYAVTAVSESGELNFIIDEALLDAQNLSPEGPPACLSKARQVIFRLIRPLVKRLTNAANFQKFKENPAVFFQSLKSRKYRIFGRIFFPRPK